MTIDATCILSSCTKLMISIAAIQCVEQGQTGLNNDFPYFLHEFKDADIITRFSCGKLEAYLQEGCELDGHCGHSLVD
jgi:hypothetical protein